MKKWTVALALVWTAATILIPLAAWAWDDGKTHKDLTDYAADQSHLGPQEDFLQNLGFHKRA